jgi:hypothetical protein
MKRILIIACMGALASIASFAQPLRADDVVLRNAVYTRADAGVPAVNVSQVVVPAAPVAYRPYGAYYRPYYAPYRAYYRPYPYRAYYGGGYGYYRPYARPYVYGGYYAPYYGRPYYSGYRRGYYW